MAVPAVEALGLSKLYRPGIGIEGIDLAVERGEVFGFIGPNGAGKTTMIRLLLDLIRPTAGSVRILGLDAQRDSLAVRTRCGYLPGDLRLPARLTGGRLLAHIDRLRGAGDPRPAEELAMRLDLDLNRRIGDLSKGNRQKIGLIAALMGEPDLLILDEPTSGLDPLRQADVQTILRERAEEGTSVFLSSHAMSEIERAADRVGIVRDGHLTGVEPVAALRASAPQSTEVVLGEAAGPEALARIAALGCVEAFEADGPRLRFSLRGSPDPLIKELAAHEVTSLVSERPDLEELIIGYYRQDPERRSPS